MKTDITEKQTNNSQQPDWGSDQFGRFLQSKFLQIKKRNPSFSLRSYAQFLKVDQSYLTKVLKGTKRFSADVMEALMTRLGASPTEAHLILGQQGDAYLEIEEEQFQFLAQWSHFAILELAKTQNFSADPRWISRRLGLHVEEVRAALKRLEAFGYIAIQGSELKVLRPNNSWSQTQYTTEARRVLQRQLAQMSVDALEKFEFEDRDHGSLTIAIDRKRVPELKQKLARFRKELGDFLQSDPEALNEVIQVTMSFFPLSTPNQIIKEKKRSPK